VSYAHQRLAQSNRENNLSGAGKQGTDSHPTFFLLKVKQIFRTPSMNDGHLPHEVPISERTPVLARFKYQCAVSRANVLYPEAIKSPVDKRRFELVLDTSPDDVHAAADITGESVGCSQSLLSL